jgi:hypothetical protein
MTHPRPARRFAPTFALAACLAAAAPAAAASPTDQAAAETLFREAKKLMADGDYEHACPKFVESQRLDPTVGTQLNVGNCFEKAGKMASAWGAFKAAEMAARDAGAKGQEGEAQRRAEALAQKLARLAIVVSPAAKVPGFEVRRDGELVGEGQWGAAVPADTGWHKIEATAPGKKAWSTTVRIEADGSSASVNVPELEVAGGDGPGAAAVPFWGGQRIAGLAFGSAGLVALAVSAGFTAKMRAKNSDSMPYCSPADPNLCHAPGVDLRNQALAAGRVATGMLIGGSAAAATGLIVFLTAPRSGAAPGADGPRPARIVPVFGPGVAGIYAQGAW